MDKTSIRHSVNFRNSLVFFVINLFICFYFWLYWVFIVACGLSLVAASGSYSSLWCAGFSLSWLPLLQSTGSRCAGFSSCGTRGQQLWHTDLVALRHVGSSQARDGTRIPCTGRQVLNHRATREAQEQLVFKLDIWNEFDTLLICLLLFRESLKA